MAAATFPFRPLRPIHAIFLAFPLPLFLAALVSDFAYWSTFQVQWTNFSSWLIAAGLVGGGFALICALIGLLSVQVAPDRKRIAYLIVLSVMWVLGFIDAFVHAKDAHATMPEGLYLSALVTLLALISCWIGYSGFHAGEAAWRWYLLIAALAIALSGCDEDPGPLQYGPNPNLPEPQRGLLPQMTIPRLVLQSEVPPECATDTRSGPLRRT